MVFTNKHIDNADIEVKINGDVTGADPRISNRGGAKDYVRASHIPSANRGRGPRPAYSCY